MHRSSARAQKRCENDQRFLPLLSSFKKGDVLKSAQTSTVTSTKHSILGKTTHKAVYDHCKTVCCSCCFLSSWPYLQLAPQRRLCRLKDDIVCMCCSKSPPSLHISSGYRIWEVLNNSIPDDTAQDQHLHLAS